MSNKIDAAGAAISIHSEFLEINDGGDLANRIWHLLDSLMIFAEEKGIDFEEVLADVTENRRIFKSNSAPPA